VAETSSPKPTETAPKPSGEAPANEGGFWGMMGLSGKKPIDKAVGVGNIGFTAWMLASLLGDIWGVYKTHQANRLKKQQEMEQQLHGGGMGPMGPQGMAPPTVQQMGFQQPQGPGGF
jgi:hypothetical protein